MILAALGGCGNGEQTTGPDADTVPTMPTPSPAPAAEPPAGEALERAGAEALEQKRRVRVIEQEFIALLQTDRAAAKRIAAGRVRDAYLALANATDDYRAQLRATLGPAAARELLEPFKKQARGLRLTAKGLDEYGEAVRTGSSRLARQGLRKMTRGETLMRRAQADLAAVTEPTIPMPDRAF